jgi:hypothetical protein
MSDFGGDDFGRPDTPFEDRLPAPALEETMPLPLPGTSGNFFNRFSQDLFCNFKNDEFCHANTDGTLWGST